MTRRRRRRRRRRRKRRRRRRRRRKSKTVRESPHTHARVLGFVSARGESFQ